MFEDLQKAISKKAIAVMPDFYVDRILTFKSQRQLLRTLSEKSKVLRLEKRATALVYDLISLSLFFLGRKRLDIKKCLCTFSASCCGSENAALMPRATALTLWLGGILVSTSKSLVSI
jgi:hypothetical protein